jgi:hypothetical protein
VFYSSVSFEGVLHVVLEFSDTFEYIIQCAMAALFLEEEFGLHLVDDCFDAGHVEDAVVQVLVEFGHVVHQEEFVHVDGVAGDGELSCRDLEGGEEVEDLLFGLLQGDFAVDAGLFESTLGVVAE